MPRDLYPIAWRARLLAACCVVAGAASLAGGAYAARAGGAVAGPTPAPAAASTPTSGIGGLFERLMGSSPAAAGVPAVVPNAAASAAVAASADDSAASVVPAAFPAAAPAPSPLIPVANVASAPAAPQGPQCDNLAGLGPDSQFRVTQQKGKAVIEVYKPNSGGRKIDIEYGDELYSQRFGTDGRLRASFALTAPSNQFTINMSESAPINCTVNVPDFGKFYRVILRWRDPVQLDLHIVEPGGRMGESGHVAGGRPNNNLSQGIGQMDIVGGVPGDGVTGEMSYLVSETSAIPPNTVFTFKVDYVTRGSQPDPPYCDDNALAAPQFEFITIENGLVNTRKMSVNHARCREKLSDARRLVPIRQ